MPFCCSTCRPTGIAFSIVACLSAGLAHGLVQSQINNPIGRIARIFDPQLVKTEDRVMWLDDRLASFAQHREHAMKVGLGYRGCRASAEMPSPTVTLDLGAAYPIDTVYLIPVQREYLDDPGIFPRRFTLEVSNHADFSERTIIFTSGAGMLPQSAATSGNPIPFKAHDTARYVRLTVSEGVTQGPMDVFGLSEIVVLSQRDVLSFGAKVTVTGDLNAQGVWYPEALTDGRTPLGIWQSTIRPESGDGDAVVLDDARETVSWTIDLPRESPLDRVVLFPYQLDRSTESSVFPEKMAVYLQLADGSEERLANEWTNPLAGASSMTPLVIPLRGQAAKSVRIAGLQPYVRGEIKVHALSEIEVWSGGENLAAGLPVSRSTRTGASELVTSLTDGFTSDKKILSVAVWLDQLFERGKIERELDLLRPVHRQLASESELNATWGSAVILGLTFLIPVFIVERRRLMSRDQIDQLRKRIASDLHDDIGSNLGSISLIARTARKDLVRLQGPEEVAEDLGEVESIARESSLAMRDIVWLLERRQDSIGDLVQRMRETASRLLREITYTLECESNKTAAKLSLDAKRHLFLFYKEAIHNVLKHSHANSVTIRLWDEDDKLGLEIVDNGIGLPIDEARAHSAIQKLEDRARILDGNLRIESSQESGTLIRLFVKRSYLTAHPTLA